MTTARPATPLDAVLAIIPVRNEAATIAAVIEGLQRQGVGRIRVVDNGSSDASAAIARHCGAEVLNEPVPGYGRACWRGLLDLPEPIGWILFCDGDGSDDLGVLDQWAGLMGKADLILGNRMASPAGQRLLTPAQRFGNGLATRLIRLGWGHRFADLGPLRLIRREALLALRMHDRGFGWTIEMQVKAVEAGLRIQEQPVEPRRRAGGESKISGTVAGSVGAGVGILTTLGGLYLRKLLRPQQPARRGA
ncbi:glycosyltransferase family 2 protein [Cyanobium sp. NS01]|uniref:glycosyltransferase family 2 protein n=1 Tax=Cyanobium sp. NS01 TaxID=261284 RepID=UPI0016465FBC|nr:glycosyltransferase family 2 protein [Cyanobium sp. NS01]QNI70248.1 putative beta-glycosyltransferase/ family 2 [Cyanobium sp. NS01]